MKLHHFFCILFNLGILYSLELTDTNSISPEKPESFTTLNRKNVTEVSNNVTESKTRCNVDETFKGYKSRYLGLDYITITPEHSIEYFKQFNYQIDSSLVSNRSWNRNGFYDRIEYLLRKLKISFNYIKLEKIKDKNEFMIKFHQTIKNSYTFTNRQEGEKYYREVSDLARQSSPEYISKVIEGSKTVLHILLENQRYIEALLFMQYGARPDVPMSNYNVYPIEIFLFNLDSQFPDSILEDYLFILTDYFYLPQISRYYLASLLPMNTPHKLKTVFHDWFDYQLAKE